MKKSTEISIKIIIVAAILGAIGYYYFNKFNKPIAPPITKSQIIKLPEKPKFSPKKEQKLSDNNDNKTLIKPKKITKNYKITIENILLPNRFNKIILCLQQDNITFNTSYKTEKILFNRVLIGPFQKKSDLRKMEAKIRNIRIKDYLKYKFKKGYYLQVGCFTKQKIFNRFIAFLKQNKIYNIKHMEVKIPKKIYSISILVNSEKKLNQIKSFLDNKSVHYKIIEESNE